MGGNSSVSMYIQEWDSFLEAAKAVFVDNPTKTRYVTKYRHCDSKLVLKVTDDTMCIKYKTDQISELKHLEELNLLFMRMATNKSTGTTTTDNTQPPKKKGKRR